ncbi:MAG: SDR family oxidoreductase, partial [Emcibacter sp.]|nr:SDR family oxidoreductase [Emcibacter sp.]
AIFDSVTWDDLDFDLWRSIHEVNLDGPFLMAKALVPLMTENNYGRIVNVVSTSFNMALPIYVAYRSAKMGLVGLTRALASLGERGITSNCVSPTLTRTPGAVEANSGNPPLFDVVRNMQSIKVDSIPDDIAYTVMFLTSEDSYWVTGQGISADGGMQFSMP